LAQSSLEVLRSIFVYVGFRYVLWITFRLRTPGAAVVAFSTALAAIEVDIIRTRARMSNPIISVPVLLDYPRSDLLVGQGLPEADSREGQICNHDQGDSPHHR
jgi:hypothetical protein